MLNKELSHFSESSKSGNQISEYLCTTFLGEFLVFSLNMLSKFQGYYTWFCSGIPVFKQNVNFFHWILSHNNVWWPWPLSHTYRCISLYCNFLRLQTNVTTLTWVRSADPHRTIRSLCCRRRIPESPIPNRAAVWRRIRNPDPKSCLRSRFCSWPWNIGNVMVSIVKYGANQVI